MKVLLTGGTGFLGKAVARALARAGHELRVLVRPGSNLVGLPEPYGSAHGDVTDRASLEAAADGCDAILHMAALVKMWLPERERFAEVNVGGLRHALEIAQARGIRLVYTSSFIAIGPRGPEPADETARHPGTSFRNDYERTKAQADEVARAAGAAGQDVVMLYPGVVYGPGDLTDANLVVKMALDHLHGRLPALVGPGDTLWSYAFVDDVAEGHRLALEKGRAGERYFLCGENVSLVGFFERLRKLTGMAPPTRHLPYGLATAVGALMVLWAELTGHPPELTPGVVGVFRAHWAYDSGKAIRELGYAPRALEQGLADTLAWLREKALV